MKTKWFLIIIPILLILVLLQSYFWVPTYEMQSKGNPERLAKFISASIADAKILNPILNADSASSQITGQVFDSLLDHDEELNLRGRLATHWNITEIAYLTVNSAMQFPDGVFITGLELKKRIEQLINQGILPQVKKIEILAPKQQIKLVHLADDSPIKVKINIPERLAIHLETVNQNFFNLLEPIIGKNYENKANIEQWVESEQVLSLEQLAKLIPIFEHNPIISFYLRQGVLFHDGHEFDADDVKFTYESIMEVKNLSPRSSDFEPIKSIDIIDNYTVQVTYKRLFSPAINAWGIGILPEHLLNTATLKQEMKERQLSESAQDNFGMRDSRFNRHPIGTGAFRFVEWKGDEFIHLSRNENYWDGAPYYKEYYYRIIPDSVTQEVEFLTGAVDNYSPEPHQVVRYKKDDNYQSFSSLSFAYSYIGYNHRRPLFADKRVRQALSLAINIDQIIKYILYGEGKRITGPYPQNTQWYNSEIKPVPYNPAKAKQILNELGWKKNKHGWLEKDGKEFEFNLITNNGNLQRKAIMTIAQNSWHKLGIKCNTQVFEWAVFLTDFVNTGQFDAVVLGWSMGIDPDLFQIWHSSQSGHQQLNFIAYNNPLVDDLIVKIREEYDIERQQQLTHQLHHILADDYPYTFLYSPLSNIVLDKKIVVFNQNGSYSPITPTKTGNLFFHFNRWKKLEFTPDF
ncbi:MAG: hypothetical protein KAH84_07715 [Thiomargarita sp.]|nr:hypothetical protein [Thiomargarita sp.]